MTEPARLPPAGLPGLRPEWSRLVAAPDASGVVRTWHVLDTGEPNPTGGTGAPGEHTTLLCVHGNPTWSYLWRRVLEGTPPGWRVIAVDQLDMGFSERTGTVRRLADRVSDLSTLTEALGVTGRTVILAHDWGGPVSLGWALHHRDQLAGVILTNTAVHQPAGSPAPSLIRLVRSAPLLSAVTERTPTFVRGTLALSRPRPSREVRAAFESPYLTAQRRAAIKEFVADIPLDADHPSAATLDAIAAGLEALADVPALLLWGPRDPVFSDLYLRDLLARLPHAEVHRFEGASHLVTEDADVERAVWLWLGTPRVASVTAPTEPVTAPEPSPGADAATDAGSEALAPLWAAIDERRDSDEDAVVEMHDGAVVARRSWRELAGEVDALAAGLLADGVRPGQRVALLVPPGIDLSLAVYACWRLGASVVVADAGLGARGIGRALRSASPDHLVGIPKAIAAARALRWPGRRIPVARLAELVESGRSRLMDLPIEVAPDAEAAVLFTSGATGPAKGVVYDHARLQRQRDALMATYSVTSTDRLVAAFAPFALYGPAMGIASVVPDMDVTAPSTLTAAALADAAAAIDATLVFASPAALENVVATAGDLTAGQRTALGRVRTVMSAGAPVRSGLLRAVTAVMPSAEPHTPYGMTEVLPVADITLAELDALEATDGVCVGRPVPGVEVRVSPLDAAGRATGALTAAAEVRGEICVRAGHTMRGYDRLWVTKAVAGRDAGWHRSGDVGHLDAAGRVWVEGRLGHVVVTDSGVVTPVGAERAAEALGGVRQAALVGVGPVGTQQVVMVVVPSAGAPRAGRLAVAAVAGAVRNAVEPVIGRGVVAVFEVSSLPVDIRHNSKIDRARVASWAEAVLAGERSPARRRGR